MIIRNGLNKIFLLSFLSVFSLSSYNSIHFTDVSESLGVRGYNYFGGHGACWVDVNGDGRLDIYVKNVDGAIYHIPNNLFINYGDYFLEEAGTRGVSDAYGLGTHGAVFADLDNDGDFDLFSTTTYSIPPSRNHIYQNCGTGCFSDITNVIHPSQDTDTSSRGVAAADFDGDGDIDLYFSNPLLNPDPYNPNPYPPQQFKSFYINNGEGTFSPQYRGISWTGHVQGVTAIDIDGDGDIDIAEAKWTPPSTIYLNDGTGYFTDRGVKSGLPSTLGMRDNGMAFGDIDNDADLDLAITGGGRIALYKNTEEFFILYQTINITQDQKGYHTCFGDFDHDCDLDMYISGGNVYENDGNGFFSLVPSNISGLEPSLNISDPRGSALGDFDNDGDLDIYVTHKFNYNILFQNDCDDSNWIEIDITDHTGRVGVIGTKLDLYLAGHLDDPQFLKGHREIHGEYGYLGQDMPTVHFGAPNTDFYDIKVTFPNGLIRVIRNIQPGRKIPEPQPSVYPPLNFSGIRKTNRLLFYDESIIILTWEQNPLNNNIQKYKIYEINEDEQNLLIEVNADTFSYHLRNAEQDKVYHFALTAVDDENRESKAAFLIVN